MKFNVHYIKNTAGAPLPSW